MKTEEKDQGNSPGEGERGRDEVENQVPSRGLGKEGSRKDVVISYVPRCRETQEGDLVGPGRAYLSRL